MPAGNHHVHGSSVGMIQDSPLGVILLFTQSIRRVIPSCAIPADISRLLAYEAVSKKPSTTFNSETCHIYRTQQP